MKLYGITEIADALEVPIGRVRAWKHNGKLPAPSAVISGVPIWYGKTIEAYIELQSLVLKREFVDPDGNGIDRPTWETLRRIHGKGWLNSDVGKKEIRHGSYSVTVHTEWTGDAPNGWCTSLDCYDPTVPMGHENEVLVAYWDDFNREEAENRYVHVAAFLDDQTLLDELIKEGIEEAPNAMLKKALKRDGSITGKPGQDHVAQEFPCKADHK